MAVSHIVIGASGAIGGAVAHQWQDRYGKARVLTYSRSQAPHLDLLDEASIKSAADAIQDGTLEAVFVATGILHTDATGPEKAARDLSADSMARVFAVNTVGPALVGKYFIPKLRRHGRSVFAALGARVGSTSDNRLGGWYSYRASKAALHSLIKTLSIEWGRKRPDLCCVALHPGTVESRLSAPFLANVPDNQLFTPETAARHLLEVVDRLTPGDTGKILAWDGQEILP